MSVDQLIPRVAVGAIVFATIVVSSTAIAGWWQMRAAPKVSAYSIGDTIDIPQQLYGGASETLVVFVRESCTACQEAAPDIAKLSAALGAMSANVPTVVLTGSTHVEADRAFAKRLGDVTHQHLAFNTLRLRTVPTMVLVNRRGTVLYSQEGRGEITEVMEEMIRRIPSR